jgi:hypothetical protein
MEPRFQGTGDIKYLTPYWFICGIFSGLILIESDYCRAVSTGILLGIIMIKSMTGFGSATGEFNGFSCRLEIKTLNGRFKEFVLRSPHLLSQMEEALKKQI